MKSAKLFGTRCLAMLGLTASVWAGMACLGCGKNCSHFNGKKTQLDLQALRLSGSFKSENASLIIKDSVTAVMTIINGTDVYEFTYQLIPSGTTETTESILE